MALDILKGQNVDAHLWSKIYDIESSALTQIKNVCKLPWVWHHAAIMADVHAGIGCTIGSVIAMKDALAPSLVGVDVGCGISAIKTNLNADGLPDDLSTLRHSIERGIPVGFNEHKNPLKEIEKLSLWQEIKNCSEKAQSLLSKALKQCGTLGSGNHFIELCLDTNNNVWIMLHSGSRNLGKTIAEMHINIAKKLTHNLDLEDKDLAVFLTNTPEMQAYRNDLYFAQNYALANRTAMINIYKKQLLHHFPQVTFEEEIKCHHNYVNEEIHYGEKVFVTRKGAIRAGKNELGIIPGSMGTCSYIVEGLGNHEAFESAPHGAGRKMSRGEAKRRFTTEDLIKQTQGVECRKDSGVIDEIPSAYKDIDTVIENSKELVKVVTKLKQIMCIKG